MTKHQIRGWIYVMTNAAMPGLVKVGFSLKDPALRAQELDGTGLPMPFVVAYEALAHSPRDLEARVHQRLSPYRYGKEFFRCTEAIAIQAIRVEAQNLLLEKTDIAAETSHSGANPAAQPPQQTRLPFSAAYQGACARCRQTIHVTLTHYDHGTHCPHCQAYNDLRDFCATVFARRAAG